MKAFIFDPLWPQLVDDALTTQLATAGVEVTVVTDVKPLRETPELFAGDEPRLLCLNPDYVGWQLAGDDYKDIPGLQAILVESTSFDWIEPAVAAERGIAICNITDFSTDAVAEWALLMMLNLARQTPRLIRDGFPLDYDADFLTYRGIQLKGKTIGIIGLGHNGAAIAARAAGLGMKVIYWSRASTSDAYAKVGLDELCARADVIVPAYAKNDETSDLLSPARLASLKSSAIVVDIIGLEQHQAALCARVQEGTLFGYGFEAKPGAFHDYSGNIWAAPAYAWVTSESMYNSVTRLVENIISASEGHYPRRVN